MLKSWWNSDKRYLVLALVFVLLGASLQAWHLGRRQALEMPISAQEGGGDLVKAGIYSLGSVRGLVATALWMEVVDAKNKRDYVRLKGNCDLLMEVQPKFTSTARFLAYTEINDIPDQMPGLQEKYYWVRSGLNILDAGYRRNPRAAELPQQLALNYSFRFADTKSDGADLARMDATTPRQAAGGERALQPASDQQPLSPVDRATGDSGQPRYSVQRYLADGKTPIRAPRCIECFYWALYYGQQAAEKNDANLQSIYTDVQDSHKKIAWYSAWSVARQHLIAARKTNEAMDADARRRRLPPNDGFRENFCSEMFYLLMVYLPRGASPAEQAEMAAETKAQWDWYLQFFVAPDYPEGPFYKSPAEAAQAYARDMQSRVADWNNIHPDEPIQSAEQLPH